MRIASAHSSECAALQAYSECFHELLTVNIGLPVSHNDYYAPPICWRCLKVKLFKHPWDLISTGMNLYITDSVSSHATSIPLPSAPFLSLPCRLCTQHDANARMRPLDC